MNFTLFDSPIGPLTLVGNEKGLNRILFAMDGRPADTEPHWQNRPDSFAKACEQLKCYFDGSLTDFELSLTPDGTEFQRSVWSALQNVQYGQTCSYKQIAQTLGRPKASRAVGAANGANPIPIVIPCHRIIASNGALTGFAGGLLAKQWLLAHESGAQSLLGFND